MLNSNVGTTAPSGGDPTRPEEPSLGSEGRSCKPGVECEEVPNVCLAAADWRG